MVSENTIVDRPCTKDEARVLHSTIKKVTADLDTFGFNTAISQMMVFVNEFANAKELPREAAEAFVKMLACFAPHAGEELWQILGHNNTVAYEPWPQYDEKFLVIDEKEILVQVLGKPKARIMISVSATKEEIEQLALNNPDVQKAIAGKEVKKIIIVPGRLINIVC